MPIRQFRCPACGSPLEVGEGRLPVRCAFCGTSLHLHDGDVAFHPSPSSTAEAGRATAEATLSELRRLRLTQELTMAEMRLTGLRRELRENVRGTQSSQSRREWKELRSQELALEQEMARLHAELDPGSAAPASVQTQQTAVRTVGEPSRRWGWLLFGLRGRLGREDFWIGALLAMVLAGGALLVLTLIATPGDAEPESLSDALLALNCLVLLVLVAALWIGFAVASKRFQDRGKSGWWALLLLLPMIGPLWVLVEGGFLPGVESERRD